MGVSFDKDIAVRCFAERLPSKEGRAVMHYWLSLWRGAQLPVRADFKPGAITEELPSIALFDVIPGESVRFRLHGSRLAQGTGQDLTGQDWIELTRPENRAVRLKRWSDVALGGIGRGLRVGTRASGAPRQSDELMLPFGDLGEGGARQVLYHLSWRQTPYDPTRIELQAVNGLADEFQFFDLRK